jgi:hypothetical protein
MPSEVEIENIREISALILAKAGKSAIYRANRFFEEFNTAKDYGAMRPVIGENGRPAIVYPGLDGNMKTVGPEDLALNANLMKNGIMLCNKAAKTL